MELDTPEARRRFAAAPVARLATVRPDGAPHVVPLVFASVGDDLLVSAVDHKPKSSARLQRLANLDHEPRCALLVDAYAEDWSRLWWVRADAEASVERDPAPDDPGLRALQQRYAAYRRRPPAGPLLRFAVTRWRGWAAGPTA